MTTQAFARRLIAGTLISVLGASAAPASDHADPMNVIKPFEAPKSQEANITDLHAFIVDEDHRLVTSGDTMKPGNSLVISLCVRRALKDEEEAMRLDFEGYTFRVHLDLDPRIRFAGAAGPGTNPAAAQQDQAMQARYGGIFTQPDDIVDDAILEFELALDKSSPEPRVKLTKTFVSGITGPTQTLTLAADGTASPPTDAIGVTTGLFEDPFIFPRFFRRNVVGIVTNIPLSHIPGLRTTKDGTSPILLWATTHKGKKQIDHVGRSLRTQLPRFGYLNDKPPSAHVREIQRVHAEPTIMEELLSAVVGPLFAHRYYDSVPDVMVYDLRKPARFPNGRALKDDVAKILADSGETLLFELSYTESRQFPRAETNDKRFGDTFPYLASVWRKADIARANADASVPMAPDSSAIMAPNLDASIWQRLALFEGVALVLLTVLLSLALRSRSWRALLAIVALIAIWCLRGVYAEWLPGATCLFLAEAAAIALLSAIVFFALRLAPLRALLGLVAVALLWRVYEIYAGSAPAAAPLLAGAKAFRLICGAALNLAFGVGLVFATGRRSIIPATFREPSSAGDRQAPTPEDARRSSYHEIYEALFDPAVSRPYYETWGRVGERPLPVYKTTLASLLAGALSLRTHGVFAMLSAARRTLLTSADLRWGIDRGGFRRLVHPMGVCLAGTWKIDADVPPDFTGYFAPGSEGRVIARYSLGGNHPKGGRNRSLGLVGKIFPPRDANEGVTPRAHFITQEDLGGAYTASVADAILTNSPPVSLLKRGSGIFGFLVVIRALQLADQEPAERQLYEIAELEKDPNTPTKCPRFMRLTVAPGARRDERVDFRDEILGMIYDRGDARTKRNLVFTIEISNTGDRTPLQSVYGQEPWRRIGTLTFHQAAASYNGDFVIHFHHPPWRTNRDDPGSVARPELRQH